MPTRIGGPRSGMIKDQNGKALIVSRGEISGMQG